MRQYLKTEKILMFGFDKRNFTKKVFLKEIEKILDETISYKPDSQVKIKFEIEEVKKVN